MTTTVTTTKTATETNLEILIERLATLTNYDSSQGIWADPNTFEYRFGQFIFENGGLLDDKVCIGSLEYLIDQQSAYAGSFTEFLIDSGLSEEEIEELSEEEKAEHWNEYQEQYLDFAREWAQEYIAEKAFNEID